MDPRDIGTRYESKQRQGGATPLGLRCWQVDPNPQRSGLSITQRGCRSFFLCRLQLQPELVDLCVEFAIYQRRKTLSEGGGRWATLAQLLPEQRSLSLIQTSICVDRGTAISTSTRPRMPCKATALKISRSAASFSRARSAMSDSDAASAPGRGGGSGGRRPVRLVPDRLSRLAQRRCEARLFLAQSHVLHLQVARNSLLNALVVWLADLLRVLPCRSQQYGRRARLRCYLRRAMKDMLRCSRLSVCLRSPGPACTYLELPRSTSTNEYLPTC